MRHFDAHAYRTEDVDGVWEFARGCMRTYLILAEKARRFDEDPEIAEALAVAQADLLHLPQVDWNDPAQVAALLDEDDEPPTAGRGHGHERLDQLVVELLMGVR
jgi:xylose isomerase